MGVELQERRPTRAGIFGRVRLWPAGRREPVRSPPIGAFHAARGGSRDTNDGSAKVQGLAPPLVAGKRGRAGGGFAASRMPTCPARGSSSFAARMLARRVARSRFEAGSLRDSWEGEGKRFANANSA